MRGEKERQRQRCGGRVEKSVARAEGESITLSSTSVYLTSPDFDHIIPQVPFCSQHFRIWRGREFLWHTPQSPPSSFLGFPQGIRGKRTHEKEENPGRDVVGWNFARFGCRFTCSIGISAGMLSWSMTGLLLYSLTPGGSSGIFFAGSSQYTYTKRRGGPLEPLPEEFSQISAFRK